MKMNTAATDNPENATPQKAQASAAKRASRERPLDDRAAARIAKKRKKRKAHRATLKRSNTGG
jgi:hypothetical protein